MGGGDARREGAREGVAGRNGGERTSGIRERKREREKKWEEGTEGE